MQMSRTTRLATSCSGSVLSHPNWRLSHRLIGPSLSNPAPGQLPGAQACPLQAPQLWSSQRSNKSMAKANKNLSPMVFSCTKCNTIVSDSTEYMCSLQDMNCIVMAGGTNIRIATERSCNILGYFQEIFCSKCNAELGKRYSHDTAHPPAPRDWICLTVSAMDSYQLGTGEVRACNRPPARAEEAAPDGAFAPESSSVQQQISALEDDLLKVQNMVLLHQERLEALEGAR